MGCSRRNRPNGALAEDGEWDWLPTPEGHMLLLYAIRQAAGGKNSGDCGVLSIASHSISHARPDTAAAIAEEMRAAIETGSEGDLGAGLRRDLLAACEERAAPGFGTVDGDAFEAMAEADLAALPEFPGESVEYALMDVGSREILTSAGPFREE